MDVYDKARELAEVLKQEEVFTQFVHWQSQVFANSKLKERLLDLRRAEFALQRRQLSGKEVSTEQKEALRRLYEAARQDETISRYLEIEYRFSGMLKDIQKIINDAVPVKRPEEYQG